MYYDLGRVAKNLEYFVVNNKGTDDQPAHPREEVDDLATMKTIWYSPKKKLCSHLLYW